MLTYSLWGVSFCGASTRILGPCRPSDMSEKCQNVTVNVRKCKKMSEYFGKCQNVTANVRKCHLICRKMSENVGKCQKMSESSRLWEFWDPAGHLTCQNVSENIRICQKCQKMSEYVRKFQNNMSDCKNSGRHGSCLEQKIINFTQLRNNAALAVYGSCLYKL